MDVDEYYREAVVRNMYLDVYFLTGRLNEVLVRHPELLGVLPGAAPAQSPDALYKLLGVLAGVLFWIAWGFEGPGGRFSLGYSYLGLAGGRPLDAVVFTFVSIALARGRGMSPRSSSGGLVSIWRALSISHVARRGWRNSSRAAALVRFLSEPFHGWVLGRYKRHIRRGASRTCNKTSL